MIKDIIENNDNVDVNKSKIEKLKQVMPNCFDKNGNLDIELLKKEFSDSVDFIKESFELNFLGKSYAKMIAGLDTETVIEPDIEHNSKEENINSDNIYISGDNIDALKHLVKAYSRKIKCIYIDPPYNTGSDGFIYNDTFRFSKEKLINKLDISEEEAERVLNMTSGNSSSHSAWLTFIYPRLYIAKQLLSDDGAIFISIDDNEYSNLKILADNIYGEENYIATFVWQRAFSPVNLNKYSSLSHDYILCYSRKKEVLDWKGLERTEEADSRYSNPDNDPRGPWSSGDCSVGPRVESKVYPIKLPSGRTVYPSTGRCWRVTEEKFNELVKDNRIWFGSDGNGVPRLKRFLSDVKEYITPMTVWGYEEVGHSQEAKQDLIELFDNKAYFEYPKSIKLLKRIINLISDEDSIILDFFSGSATTAQAVLEINAEKKDSSKRKYIMVQLPETISERSEAYKDGFRTIDEIGQERIKRAANKIKKETNADIDYGFKHYTLKETPDDLLNKLELFKPEIVNDNYNIYKEYGIDTILETWKLKDGYEFTTNIDMIDCGGYEAYKCKECLYLINPNITVKNIQVLLDKYNQDDTFVCDKLVIFGYSFRFDEIEMIKNNIKQVKNFKNIDVKVYTRY